MIAFLCIQAQSKGLVFFFHNFPHHIQMRQELKTAIQPFQQKYLIFQDFLDFKRTSTCSLHMKSDDDHVTKNIILKLDYQELWSSDTFRSYERFVNQSFWRVLKTTEPQLYFTVSAFLSHRTQTSQMEGCSEELEDINILEVIHLNPKYSIFTLSSAIEIKSLMPQLTEIISQLSQNCLYLKALKQTRHIYNFTYNDLKVMSPYSVFQLLKKLNQRAYPPNETSTDRTELPQNLSQECWHPSQFKLFTWMSVCYAFTINKEIKQFKTHNIEFLEGVFPRKKSIFIIYNLLCLQKQSKSKEEWSQEQKQLLLILMRDERFKSKWSDISYQLYCLSNTLYFRNAHSCREMWFNHLNPVVNHSKWTPEEDIELFKLANQMGTKWAKISKSLDGVRTQHMVKNRFNSIHKKYQSRYQRCSTKKIIQLVLKHLESKYENQKGVEESSIDKDSEANNQSQISLKKSNEIIEEESEQNLPELDEQECKNQELISNQIQVVKEVFPPQNSLIVEEDEEKVRSPQKGFVLYEPTYQNIKMQTIQCEGSLADWVECNRRNVELVDYTDYYQQFKQTIFSGTNS